MMDDRQRRMLIRAISIVMIMMAVAFFVYLSVGYLTNDATVNRLLAALIPVGGVVIYVSWRLWLSRQYRRGPRRGFMQGYRRKYRDED